MGWTGSAATRPPHTNTPARSSGELSSDQNTPVWVHLTSPQPRPVDARPRGTPVGVFTPPELRPVVHSHMNAPLRPNESPTTPILTDASSPSRSIAGNLRETLGALGFVVGARNAVNVNDKSLMKVAKVSLSVVE